jgi:hypothetical protein
MGFSILYGKLYVYEVSFLVSPVDIKCHAAWEVRL